MKTHSKTIVILTCIISILGCGGEEESKPVEVATPVEVSTAPPPVDNSVPETTITADLISSPDFGLSSSNDLQINLSASPSTTTGYFINICTDFDKPNSNNYEGININYASCKLRTKVASTAQEFTLAISPVEKELIAQLWPIENGAKPINFYWNIADSGNNWQITF